MSAAARIGGYLSAQVARAGGTELEQDIAYELGSCFNRGPDVQVSVEHLRTRVRDRGVRSGRYWSDKVGYGTIVRVLEILRGKGLWWPKAHVARWHGPLPPNPDAWPVLRPRSDGNGGYRLPARKLSLVGWARSLAGFLSAPGAEWIEPYREVEGATDAPASPEDASGSPSRTSTASRTYPTRTESERERHPAPAWIVPKWEPPF